VNAGAPPPPPPPTAPPPNPPPSDAGEDTGVDAGPTLSGDVQPIFTSSCAVNGCHTTASHVGSLDLSLGNAYGATVNVASIEKTGTMRVAPGNAEASYLYLKITGRPEPGDLSDPPPSTGLVLTQKQKDTVRDWINAGAKDD
jgi:hypothetical protein